MGKRMKKVLAFVIITVIGGLFIYIVWPTQAQPNGEVTPVWTELTSVHYGAMVEDDTFYRALPDKETGKEIDYGDPYLGDRVMTPTPPPDYSWEEPLPGWISIDGIVFENWDCFGLRKIQFENCDYNKMRIAQEDDWDSSAEYRYIYTPTPTATPIVIPPPSAMFNVKVTGDHVNLDRGLNVRKCGASLYNSCTAFFILPNCEYQPQISWCTNEVIPVYEIKYKEYSAAHPLDTGWWLNVVCHWSDPDCDGNYWIPGCLDDDRCFTDWKP